MVSMKTYFWTLFTTEVELRVEAIFRKEQAGLRRTGTDNSRSAVVKIKLWFKYKHKRIASTSTLGA